MAVAEEMDSSVWLALVAPLGLETRITYTEPRGLRVPKGWFPRENGGVVAKDGRMDSHLPSHLKDTASVFGVFKASQPSLV